MPEASFGVEYDGPALTHGQMPVRDLAPALFALGELFADASRLLHSERAPVALNIKATAEGSFWVQLVLEGEGVWEQVRDIFSSATADALVNFRDLVIAGGFGVIYLIKRLRGRRIRRQRESQTPGHTILVLDDGTDLDIPTDSLLLYQNVSIRKQAKQVVAPVAREGVERLRFTQGPDRAATVVVEKDDLPAYELPETKDTLLEDERDMVVEIVSPYFAEGRKWRFHDGQNIIQATIEDADFIRRVEEGIEAFRMGDMLRCQMRVIQTQRPEGLRTEYQVVRVVRHIPRAEQLRLHESEPPEPTSP